MLEQRKLELIKHLDAIDSKETIEINKYYYLCNNNKYCTIRIFIDNISKYESVEEFIVRIHILLENFYSECNNMSDLISTVRFDMQEAQSAEYLMPYKEDDFQLFLKKYLCEEALNVLDINEKVIKEIAEIATEDDNGDLDQIIIIVTEKELIWISVFFPM